VQLEIETQAVLEPEAIEQAAEAEIQPEEQAAP
jgi:hypothetical protein